MNTYTRFDTAFFTRILSVKMSLLPNSTASLSQNRYPYHCPALELWRAKTTRGTQLAFRSIVASSVTMWSDWWNPWCCDVLALNCTVDLVCFVVLGCQKNICSTAYEMYPAKNTQGSRDCYLWNWVGKGIFSDVHFLLSIKEDYEEVRWKKKKINVVRIPKSKLPFLLFHFMFGLYLCAI